MPTPSQGTYADRKEQNMPRPPFRILAVLALAVAPSAFAQEAPSPLPAEVAASVAQYDGKCPCPYTLKANGKPCGGSSAYSRPGGQVVVCFAEDLANLPPCQTEDGDNCHWDAAARGNGEGRSFNAVGGQLFYL